MIPGVDFARNDLSDADMDFHVASAGGRKFCLAKLQKRVGPERHVEFYEWKDERNGWVAIPLRLTLLSAIKSGLLDSTWPPAFAMDMSGNAEGFEFSFNSNNWDPPDHRWHAAYSTRTRRISLRRGAKL
jgi:hypothetical protein